jgi:hypothetical protein
MTLAMPGLIDTRPRTNAPLEWSPTPALPISRWQHRPLAAIRIGIDEVALKIVRPIVAGGGEVVHFERTSIECDEARTQGRAPGRAPAETLSETLVRYGRFCRAHGAIRRAVAGSAFCSLPGASEVIARAQREAALEIEPLSSRQEAQLLCRGVLTGRTASERALLVTSDGPNVSLVFAVGDQPVALWALGWNDAGSREIAGATVSAADDADATELRQRARRMVSEARLGAMPRTVGHVLLASDGARLAWGQRRQLEACNPRRGLFPRLILEALLAHLGLDGIKISQASLVDGLLADPTGAGAREALPLS